MFWRLDAQPWETLLKAKHLSTGTQCCNNIYSAIPNQAASNFPLTYLGTILNKHVFEEKSAK